MTLAEVQTVIAALGQPKFRAKQIYQWLQVHGVMDYSEMTNISKELRQTLSENYPIRYCEI